MNLSLMLVVARAALSQTCALTLDQSHAFTSPAMPRLHNEQRPVAICGDFATPSYIGGELHP
jgi:hypothetical protein